MDRAACSTHLALKGTSCNFEGDDHTYYIYTRGVLKKKNDVERRLDTTAQRTSIESYLNGLFFLKNREIQIEEIDNSNKVYVYFADENQIAPFINNKFILYELGEVPDKPNFIVHIPTFLCTSLEIEKDKYKGEFLTKIVNALNVYKPAGKRYSINLYEV